MTNTIDIQMVLKLERKKSYVELLLKRVSMGLTVNCQMAKKSTVKNGIFLPTTVE